MTQQPPSSAVDPALPTASTAVQDAPVRTPWTEFWRKFRKQHVAVAALALVLVLVLLAVFAPAIVPYDAENFFDYEKLNDGPSWQHWLGVDRAATF